jgi:hypothetical protein
MTYDVAVWEGKRPSDDEAGEMLERLMDAAEARDESGMPPEPPTPGIAAFMSDLLDRWPDIDQPDGENSPWAMSGLREDASGALCYLCMTNTPLLDEAVAYIAELARKHGLICYDPQFEEVIS